jgi:hypothetical protein
MQWAIRTAVAIAYLIGAPTVFAAADALTDSDFQYLKADGWAKDNYIVRCKLTGARRPALHALINDPKTAGKKKSDAVDDFLESVGFDEVFDKLDKAKAGIHEQTNCAPLPK